MKFVELSTNQNAANFEFQYKAQKKLKQKNRSKISWYEISICWPKCKRKSTAIEEQLHIQAGNKMKINQWIMAERRQLNSCDREIVRRYDKNIN